MAVKKASDVVASGNVEIPRDRYTLRVVDAKHGISRAGNNQITLECEVVGDQPIEYKGRKVMIGGKKVRYYLPLNDDRLGDVIGEGCGSVHDKLGLPLEIDTEAPDTQQYVGLVFDAILESREKKAMKKNEDGSYAAILDADGKEIVQGHEINAQLNDILGLNTTVQAN